VCRDTPPPDRTAIGTYGYTWDSQGSRAAHGRTHRPPGPCARYIAKVTATLDLPVPLRIVGEPSSQSLTQTARSMVRQLNSKHVVG
jgi:hypothetical protein